MLFSKILRHYQNSSLPPWPRFRIGRCRWRSYLRSTFIQLTHVLALLPELLIILLKRYNKDAFYCFLRYWETNGSDFVCILISPERFCVTSTAEVVSSCFDVLQRKINYICNGVTRYDVDIHKAL